MLIQAQNLFYLKKGVYGGASVASRVAKTIDQIPKDIESDFASTALKFGFDYYSMCVSDVTKCPN